jgi:dCTP deaminase
VSILPDHMIRQLCIEHAMVVPFDPELLNPASLDVTLGDTLLLEVEHTAELMPLSIAGSSQAEPYWLAPGEFVLAQTRELFNIPNDIAARFALKSSRAREGIEHLLAGFADPGFYGAVMTLELQNARRLHSVPIWAGMKIGQMTFERLAAPAEVSYAVKGHYNRDTNATASRGHL